MLTTTNTDLLLGMKAAFEILGIPSWHWVEMGGNTLDLAMWNEVLESKVHPEDPNRLPLDRKTFDNLLGQFGACTDQPAAIVAEELVAAYPEAKVILIERDVDKWLESFRNTVIAGVNSPGVPFVRRIDRECMGAMARQTDIICEHYFHMTSKRESWLRNNPEFFEEWLQNSKAAYLAHNAEVKRVTPAERLLLFQLDQGWEPLCKFLDKPVPDVPFPRVNDTEELNKRVAMYLAEGMRRGLIDIARKAALAVVLLMSAVVWYVRR